MPSAPVCPACGTSHWSMSSCLAPAARQSQSQAPTSYRVQPNGGVVDRPTPLTQDQAEELATLREKVAELTSLMEFERQQQREALGAKDHEVASLKAAYDAQTAALKVENEKWRERARQMQGAAIKRSQKEKKAAAKAVKATQPPAVEAPTP